MSGAGGGKKKPLGNAEEGKVQGKRQLNKDEEAATGQLTSSRDKARVKRGLGKGSMVSVGRLEDDAEEGVGEEKDEEEWLESGSGELTSEEDDQKDDQKDEEDESDEKEEEKEDPSLAADRMKMWARARGLADISSSEEEEGEEEETEGSESSSSSDGLSESDLEEPEEEGSLDLSEWGVGALAANPEEDIPLVDGTRRLAVVDLDWQHVRAVDILVVLRSFTPKGGEVQKVTIYVSDYGLERMPKDALLGPTEIFKASAGGRAQDANDASPPQSDDDSGVGEVDKHRLALYERSKLRWYYAVAECDTIATALHIYNECDGMEFAHLSCKFDLRFIPDEQSFKGRPVKESVTEVPVDYKPIDGGASTLQHTDPKLSWDADDHSRKKLLSKKMTLEELKEDDFAAYLGSDSSDDGDEGNAGLGGEEDAEAIRQRYLSLLVGNVEDRERKEDEAEGEKEEEEGPSGRKDKDMEMMVTFNPGLENLAERVLSRKKAEAKKGEETVWEAYLRRRKEKRQMKKHRRGADSSDDDDEDDEDVGDRHGPGEDEAKDDEAFSDPFFEEDNLAAERELMGLVDDEEDEGLQAMAEDKKNLNKKKKGKKDKKNVKTDEADRRAKAELELLLLDDSALLAAAQGAGALHHAASSLHAEAGVVAGKKLTKKERRLQKAAAKKLARNTGSDDEDLREDGFQPDLEDPRFRELFTSHLFAMDPTDPRFAKSKGVSKIAESLAKKKKDWLGSGKDGDGRPGEDEAVKKAARGAVGHGVLASSEDGGAPNRDKKELKAMVMKLKRNSAASGSTVNDGGRRIKRRNI